MERQSHTGLQVVYLAEECELVIGKESIGLIHEEVSPDELLEAPVFSLDKPE